MKRLSVLFFFSAILPVAQAQIQGKFIPENNKQIMFIGQDMSAIGGFGGEENGQGYIDHIEHPVTGVTFYTNFPDLGGLYEVVNHGGGDGCAQCIIDNSKYDDVALAIGLYLVDQLGEICAGKQDRTIKSLARWIRYSKRPVFLRIGYEFDGAWNHYDPAEYVQAYRRIVDVFRDMKVDNCAFVWQSCTSPIDDIIDGGTEDITRFYPGDDYVDWMGYSWFVNTKKQIELTDELVSFARAHNKPVMVCESTPQGYDLSQGTQRFLTSIYDGPSGQGRKSKSGQDIWDEWFAPFFNYIEKNNDVIRAVSYINCNWDAQPMWGPPYTQGYWGDARVQANPYILQMWLDEVTSDKYLQFEDGNFQQLGYDPRKRQ